MGKKIIINETALKKIAEREILQEANDDIVKAVRDALKNNREINGDLEKKVKSIVAKSVNTLFQTLWQRRNFYEDEIKK